MVIWYQSNINSAVNKFLQPQQKIFIKKMYNVTMVRKWIRNHTNITGSGKGDTVDRVFLYGDVLLEWLV